MGWFPTRLIDIGLSKNCNPRLLITSEVPPDGPYVTLSHCWGSVNVIQLKCESLNHFTNGIAITDLPKTFVDAICVTRRLGFRYIWIDSLCIIQDSPGDWLREAMLMYLVYSNSICNIAATGSIDVSIGLFRSRNVHILFPCEINTYYNGIEDPLQYHIIDRFFWKTHLCNAPLNQRSWVVQERFLAPRNLHFGSQQLFWECREFDAAEKYPMGLPMALKYSAAFKSFDPVFDASRMRTITGREWDAGYNFNMLWNKLVEAYSSSRLTKPEDKLIAFAGVAKITKIPTTFIVDYWHNHRLNFRSFLFLGAA